MDNTIIENFDSNQNEKSGSKNNENSTKHKLRFNHLNETQKKTILGGGSGLAGLLLGAGAFTLMGFSNKEGEVVSKPEVSEDDTECVDVFTEAPVASTTSSEMSFSEAFKSAREEVGAGGFFMYKNEVYNTYTKEEWDAMSDMDKEDYANSFANKVSSVQSVESVSTENEQVATTEVANEVDNKVDDKKDDKEPEASEVNKKEEETNQADEKDEKEEEVNEVDEKDIEFEAPELVKEADVISRVDANSDYSIDAYEVDFDKDDNPDFVIDSDGDGKFDELVLDMRSPGASGEIIDIAPLDTSKLEDVKIVDEDGNVIQVHDNPADGTATVANEGLAIKSEDLEKGHDLDGDGNADAFIIQANDNYVDDIAIDVDNSGTIDMVIMDVESIETDERIQDAFELPETMVEEVIDDNEMEGEFGSTDSEMDDDTDVLFDDDEFIDA